MAIRTTAVVNLKGGVAKSTTVINMAAILSKKHEKLVCIIDADSQCNTTEFFGADPKEGNLATVLRESSRHQNPGRHAAENIQGTGYWGIDILAGDDSLMDLDLSKVEQQTVDASVLRSMIEEIQDAYDYALIDCPPAFNAASAAALVAADDVIIPIKLDAFSLRGMVNLMRQIKNMRQINPRLKICGILPTMWYRDKNIQEAEQQLKNAGLHVFPHIRRSDKVDTMTFRQEPLLISSPKSAAGKDYQLFVQEYVGGSSHV